MSMLNRGMLLLFIAGCAEGPEADLSSADTGLSVGRLAPPPPPPTVDAPIAPADAEMADRWIYHGTPGGACPAANGAYHASKLFGAGAPPGLGGFCLFEANVPGGGGACPLASGVCDPTDIAPDLMVVLPAALDAKDVIANKMRERFVQQMGVVPGVIPSRSGRLPARIGLFDASPDSGPAAATGSYASLEVLHGYNLANIINTQPKDSTGASLIEPFANLALQLKLDAAGNVVADPMHGGAFGSISYLAAAIHQEVNLWKPSRSQRGLVVNLSVGWDPEWGGDGSDPSDWTPPIQALYASLEFSKCEGALAFAAAGNKIGGPTPDTDPLFPAGWGALGFDVSVCPSYGVGYPVTYLDDTPLVYAVGGVDEANRRLVNSRNNSQPRLVAFGDHAAVTDVYGVVTDPMTGTSVSTALVSAAAAAVWANRPTMTSVDVAEALYDSGVAVATEDPFWCDGPCEPVRRVDVCKAVQFVCDATSAGYTGVPCDRSTITVPCTNPTPAVPITPPAALYSQLLTEATEVDLTPDAAIYHEAACGGAAHDLRQSTFTRAFDPCPLEQYYTESAEPWLYPQPRSGECPSCFLMLPSGMVTLQWSDTSPPTSVTFDSISISIYDSLGAKRTFTHDSPITISSPVLVNLTSSAVVGTEKAEVAGVIGDTTYTAPLAISR